MWIRVRFSDGIPLHESAWGQLDIWTAGQQFHCKYFLSERNFPQYFFLSVRELPFIRKRNLAFVYLHKVTPPWIQKAQLQIRVKYVCWIWEVVWESNLLFGLLVRQPVCCLGGKWLWLMWTVQECKLTIPLFSCPKHNISFPSFSTLLDLCKAFDDQYLHQLNLNSLLIALCNKTAQCQEMYINSHCSSSFSEPCHFIQSTCDRYPDIPIAHFEGILPKGPFPPCLRMADRALLAGYPRLVKMRCVFIVSLKSHQCSTFILSCSMQCLVRMEFKRE